MKDSKTIIAHLVKHPSFEKCAHARCYQMLLSLLPGSFTQWVKFLYIRHETLFFVLSHPCAKMEFHYKQSLIKSLLSQIPLHHPECSFLHVTQLKAFVSDQHPSTLQEQKETTLRYPERAEGYFNNCASDPALHALFEKIKEAIRAQQTAS